MTDKTIKPAPTKLDETDLEAAVGGAISSYIPCIKQPTGFIPCVKSPRSIVPCVKVAVTP